MAIRFLDITFKGEATGSLLQPLETVTVGVGGGVTRLRVETPEPSLVHGLLEWVKDSGLELLDVRSRNAGTGS